MPELTERMRRWHCLSIGEAEHPAGELQAPGADLSARDEQLGILEADLYDAEAAGDEQRAQDVLSARHELLKPERTRHQRVIDASNGAARWPAEVVWVREDGPRKWPPFVHTIESNVDFVDARAEEELSRLLPEGSWSTTEAQLRDLDGNDVTTHRLLVVSSTVRILEWESPEPDEGGNHDMVMAVADSERGSSSAVARALGAEPFGTGLWVHPVYHEAISESRVLRLAWSPVPWETEVRRDVEGWTRSG